MHNSLSHCLHLIHYSIFIGSTCRSSLLFNLFLFVFSLSGNLSSGRGQRVMCVRVHLSSGFRRDTFVFLYPFLLTILFHLCSNIWYILNIVHLRKYQSIEMQHFYDYCSRDMLEMSFDAKQCACVRQSDHHDRYVIQMSCIRVKLLIELIQLMPFIR